MRQIKRRTFLRGVGVLIGLPAFESLGQESRAGATTAKRFVCVAPNYGIYPGGFFPEQTGSDYVMPPLLESLKPHRQDISIFTNLDHPDVGGGHGCSNTLLNGVELKDSKDNPQRMFSLDQLLAEQIGSRNRFPSLLLGSGGISWSRAGIRLPTQSDPRQIFAKLFLDDPKRIKQQARQFIAEDMSILDVVREDARRLTGRLTRTDRDKLDEYLTGVREVERQLQRRQDWINVEKPRVKDTVVTGDGDDRIVDLTYPYNTNVLYDLMVLALQTDSTRVICFGHPGGNRLFPFEGVKLGYHSLTHHGKRPDLLKQLAIIESYYARQFSRFLTKMKETRDVEGRSLLDSTVVLFGSGMGNASSHSSRNLPIILAGGGLRHGSHHRFARHGRDGLPLSNLFVSVLQRLGVEQDQFSSSKGDLNHLLV